MGIFRQFPYTNFHEMNLDEIIKLMKTLTEEWLQYHTTWDEWRNETNTAFEELRQFVIDSFDNLNVTQAVSDKIDEIAKELDKKDRNWRAFDLVKHFKGDRYRIISLGVDTETEKEVVIYKKEDGTGNIWVRPLDMFNSKVDKEKYPNCEQEYRFELIERI